MTRQEQDPRWERLYRLLEPVHARAAATARSLCRSSDEGDDLYQEAVLRAYEKLPTLRDEARFRSWFFAVLLTLHRSRVRRSFWRRFLPLARVSPDEADLQGQDGRDGAEAFLGARRAARALARLPVEQREAVVLHELEGFSMAEVAEMQGVTVAAVKSRVLRGRERLKAHYRARGYDPDPTGALLRSVDSLVPVYSSPGNRRSLKGGGHEGR
jgi:RNA polymerase sigma-70 factor (ECF subfamily)